MKNYLQYLSLFFFIFFVSCSADDDSIDTSPSDLVAETFTDLSYGSHMQQKIDVHLPAGRSEARTPAVVMIHGGGWTGGDKSEMNGFIWAFRQQFPDLAVINVNYVLATDTHYAYPNQFNDMTAIMDYIDDHRDEWDIAPRYMMLGVSAGGHIASLFSYSQDMPQIKAVCNIVGPVDFNDPYYTEHPLFSSLVAFLIDPQSIPAGTDGATYLSPVTHAGNGRTPTISFFGDADELVPLSQKDRLEAALSQHSVLHHSYSFAGDHGGIGTPENFAMFMQNLETFMTDIEFMPE